MGIWPAETKNRNFRDSGHKHTAHRWMKEIQCVHGVVTAVDGEGFYLQSLEQMMMSGTSEGIYMT